MMFSKGLLVKRIASLICLLLIVLMTFYISSCSSSTLHVHANDLMEGIKAKNIAGRSVDDQFIDNTYDFSIELFKRAIDEKDNSLVSPISVMMALSMTANGADKETLSQMEHVLGKDMPIDELNEYLYTYTNSLPSNEKSKLEIANSIWFRDDENRLKVEKDFLQKNADYYNADIYKAPFDESTLKDINNCVSKNTDGMIDKILDEIKYDAVLYLINAITFDAEWETVYNKSDVFQDDFTTIGGSKETVDFMRSEEQSYLTDDNAIGFIKPYKDNKYSFVALLPNESLDINKYIETLSGEKFLNIINKAEETRVTAIMPKFSYDYKIKLNDALIDMDMIDGFSDEKADFTKMARSSRGNIFIFELLHKTFISVDELGTKAGAVTKVEMHDECAIEMEKMVNLNRPFVYVIIDNSTNLPIFIGTMTNVGK